MIQLNHLTKTYKNAGGRVEALLDVSLHIPKGQFVAVLGPSGSGKTTLMNILGCLDEPTGGQYLLGGMPVPGASPKQKALLRNEQIGFIFQSFNLVPALTAQENVELPLAFRGLSPAQRREIAHHALEQVGLAPRAHHRPCELSGGQQQRVAIARAIAAAPPLILADEPTGNLDKPSGRLVMNLLARLHQKGHTLVLITHDPDVAALAQRRLTMADGRLLPEQ